MIYKCSSLHACASRKRCFPSVKRVWIVCMTVSFFVAEWQVYLYSNFSGRIDAFVDFNYTPMGTCVCFFSICRFNLPNYIYLTIEQSLNCRVKPFVPHTVIWEILFSLRDTCCTSMPSVRIGYD